MKAGSARGRRADRLDPDTLTFSEREEAGAAGERPTLAQVEAVVLGAQGPVSRGVVSAALGCSPTTARDRLDRLVAGGRLRTSAGTRGAVLYQPADPHPSPTPVL